MDHHFFLFAFWDAGVAEKKHGVYLIRIILGYKIFWEQISSAVQLSVSASNSPIFGWFKIIYPLTMPGTCDDPGGGIVQNR